MLKHRIAIVGLSRLAAVLLLAAPVNAQLSTRDTSDVLTAAIQKVHTLSPRPGRIAWGFDESVAISPIQAGEVSEALSAQLGSIDQFRHCSIVDDSRRVCHLAGIQTFFRVTCLLVSGATALVAITSFDEFGQGLQPIQYVERLVSVARQGNAWVAASMTVTAIQVSMPAGLSLTMGGDTLVTSGDVLHVWLHVRNQTDSTLMLDLGGDDLSSFNPVVEDETGQPIWDRVHGTVIGGTQKTIRIPPHGEHDFTTAWGLLDWARNPVPPGRYVIRGRLRLAGRCPLECFVDADNSPLDVVIRPKK